MREFYKQISDDLNVNALGETWLGSEIADSTRITEFANYYFDKAELPIEQRDELAQVVWESFELGWAHGQTPSPDDTVATARVMLDAQENKYFCWYIASIILFSCQSKSPWPERAWLFDLPGFNLTAVMIKAAQHFEKIVKDRNS